MARNLPQKHYLSFSTSARLEKLSPTDSGVQQAFFVLPYTRLDEAFQRHIDDFFCEIPVSCSPASNRWFQNFIIDQSLSKVLGSLKTTA